MTRQDWTAIAEAIAEVRGRVRGANKLLVDRVADAVCVVLKERSTRFSPRRFVRIARGK